MPQPPRRQPNWDHLYEVAAAQAGHFTTQQASEAGYSTQLLYKHIQAGRVVRLHRGIYRLVHFPAADHEDLVVAWLWSEQAGVVSHLSALGIHNLSDALPARIDLTLPLAWRGRRLRVLPGVHIHHADVPRAQRGWVGCVPVTNPQRTLEDCARASVSPELVLAAVRQAIHRGLVNAKDLDAVRTFLAPYGGIPS